MQDTPLTTADDAHTDWPSNDQPPASESTPLALTTAVSVENVDLRPRWMRELERLTGFKTQIYLYGQVKDTVLYPLDANWDHQWKLGPLREALFEFFRSRGGYRIVASYDLIDGMSFADEIGGRAMAPASPGTSADAGKAPTKAPTEEDSCDTFSMAELYAQLVEHQEKQSRGPKGGRHPRPLNPDEPLDLALHQMRSCLLNNRLPCAFIVEYASQLVGAPNHLQLAERLSFLRLLKAASQSQTIGVREPEGDGIREVQNVLVLVCDKLTDLPPWLYLNNPFSGSIEIEPPRSYERRHFFERFFKSTSSLNEDSSLRELVDLTDGMNMRDLFGIRKVGREARNQPVRNSSVKELVDRYKYGKRESEWDNLRPERLANAEAILSRRVIGQEAAVQSVADVLRRARLNLSGAQHSSRSKPRGVLFFAGPTGVGKTELAKAMAELVFGTQDACIRFDMSEYGQSHSDQRLMGAPPGYVGYEEGGQLTNRVKANPFSVLLFDEIEKAHPSILDKFLQILEDGRMTDGRGDTVYFSESIIVFTSNVGIYQLDPTTGRPQVDPYSGKPLLHVDPEHDADYPTVRAKILDGVNSYFKHILGRPELLNRIGQNIVVFDFVREPTMRRILEQKVLLSIAAQISEQWQVKVVFEKAVSDRLLQLGAHDVASGGRGIGNLAEAAILNPLARLLFRFLDGQDSIKGTLAGKSIVVTDIEVDAAGSPHGHAYDVVWHEANSSGEPPTADGETGGTRGL